MPEVAISIHIKQVRSSENVIVDKCLHVAIGDPVRHSAHFDRPAKTDA